MSLGGAFRASDPLLSSTSAMTNSRNWKDPGYAANPFKSGSMANAGLNFMAPGLGMVMGKGGGEQGTAYAKNEFDLMSANSRDFIEKYLRTGEAAQRKDFQDQVQRGIQERVAAKMLENARKIGPNLKASEVKSVPAFLRGGQSGPLVYSGADRGTLQGAALEQAIREGKMETPDIENKLGPKGSPTGLANEAIPKFTPTRYEVLTPAQQLHAGAQMQAQSMNQPRGGK